MKDLISEQKFLLKQPSYPEKTPADKFYHNFANRLANIIENENLLSGWPRPLHIAVALGLTGYLQDILTDSGLWRSFIQENNSLYGRWLPFYEVSENYIPNELNPEDVRFLIWYTLSMMDDERRVWNPLDSDIGKAASRLHKELDMVYEDDEAPVPADFFMWRELDIDNPAEADDIFHFGNWLFMHSYLMTPAYAMTLSEILADPEFKGGENMDLLHKTLEESLMDDPTGPLALYLREWIFLILKGEMPPNRKSSPEDAPEHPYYTAFMKATGGIPIRFFENYNDLNRFFIDALGWDEGENLPSLKEKRDFVLLVNKEKGMLCAAGVAKCIDLPGNPCYDKEFAKDHAIDLLTIRGIAPGDLLHYLFAHDGLPDARFPHTEDYELVRKNADFIARCYLQKYYRGD